MGIPFKKKFFMFYVSLILKFKDDRKNHVVKKNRVENGFFYEKIAYKKCVIFPQLYIVKIGKMRALTFYELKNFF